METIKGKRTVEIEATTYKFESSSGDYHKSLTIMEGGIGKANLVLLKAVIQQLGLS